MFALCTVANCTFFIENTVETRIQGSLPPWLPTELLFTQLKALSPPSFVRHPTTTTESSVHCKVAMESKVNNEPICLTKSDILITSIICVKEIFKNHNCSPGNSETLSEDNAIAEIDDSSEMSSVEDVDDLCESPLDWKTLNSLSTTQQCYQSNSHIVIDCRCVNSSRNISLSYIARKFLLNFITKEISRLGLLIFEACRHPCLAIDCDIIENPILRYILIRRSAPRIVHAILGQSSIVPFILVKKGSHILERFSYRTVPLKAKLQYQSQN
ncbi:hypothetical protein ACOME3_000963 [Neoechinorhynchus agilis]